MIVSKKQSWLVLLSTLKIIYLTSKIIKSPVFFWVSSSYSISTVEPCFLNLISFGRLFKKWFIQKLNHVFPIKNTGISINTGRVVESRTEVLSENCHCMCVCVCENNLVRTKLFAMRGAREPRFDCITDLKEQHLL